MRIAAKCGLTVGTAEPGCVRMLGGHVERRDGVEAEASRLAPREKLPHRPPVRHPRSLVRDPPREEPQEPRNRIRPRIKDQPRQMSLSVTADVAAATGTNASLIRTPLPCPPFRRRRAPQTARNRRARHLRAVSGPMDGLLGSTWSRGDQRSTWAVPSRPAFRFPATVDVRLSSNGCG